MTSPFSYPLGKCERKGGKTTSVTFSHFSIAFTALRMAVNSCGLAWMSCSLAGSVVARACSGSVCSGTNLAHRNKAGRDSRRHGRLRPSRRRRLFVASSASMRRHRRQRSAGLLLEVLDCKPIHRTPLQRLNVGLSPRPLVARPCVYIFHTAVVKSLTHARSDPRRAANKKTNCILSLPTDSVSSALHRPLQAARAAPLLNSRGVDGVVGARNGPRKRLPSGERRF
jgi:hypothetical protein